MILRTLMHAFGCILAAAAIVSTSAAEPIPEAGENTIGYPTVAAALATLQAKSGVTITLQNGWTLVQDLVGDEVTLWTFTPATHPAHPSAVKRTLINRDGATHLEMKVRCEAGKSECDELVREFQELNADVTRALKGDHP